MEEYAVVPDCDLSVPDAVTMDEPACNVSHLPDSVLLDVFSHLSLVDLLRSVEPVCRHWRGLALDRSLWRTMDLSWRTALYVTDHGLTCLLAKVGHRVEVLRLNWCLKLTENALDGIVSAHCDNLKEVIWPVNFSKTISAESLLKFVKCYPNLENYEFDVNSCENFPFILKESGCGMIKKLVCFMDSDEDTENDMSQTAVYTVACQSPKLMVLETDMIGEDLLAELTLCCPLIKRLSLRSAHVSDISAAVRNLTLQELDLSLTFVSDRELCAALDHLSRLTSINLSGCRLVTDVGIMALAQRCHALRRMVLNSDRYSEGGNVTDVGLSEIGKCIHGLRVLHVPFCSSVTHLGIQKLAEGCTKLTEINIQGCMLTETAFFALSHHCKDLRKIDASECLQIKSTVVERLLTYLPCLESLLLESCTFVSNLQLPGCDHSLLEKTTTQALAQSNIKTLDLNFCCNFQPSGLVVIAHFCPSLAVLNLGSCCYLTNSSITILATSCRRLRSLDITNSSSFRVSELTDGALHSLAVHCPSLQTLHVTGNYQMTLAGFTELLEQCVTLDYLRLTLWADLTFEQIAARMKSCRGSYRLMSSVSGETVLAGTQSKATSAGQYGFIFPQITQ